MRPAHVFANPTDEHYHQLVCALHQWRTAVRIVMVVLSANGWPPAEIAALLHHHPATVRRWISRYHTEGVPGLPDRPRSGRPRLGGPELGQRIAALLAVPKAWTVTRIWRALGKPKLSLATLHRRVREHARWSRPRLTAKGDPDHDTVCAAIRARITALPTGSIVLAADETHLDWLAKIRACWMPNGMRYLVPTPGSNKRRTIFGAVNLATGAFHYHLAVKGVSIVFCYFLDMLLAAYPDAPQIVVITDNGSIHHSGITRKWLATHPRIQIIEGARYSPQDNPTERMWAALKNWIANTAPATMADRIRQAHAFFRHRTPQQMLAATAPWTSPWLPESYAQNIIRPA
jgi:transposase